MENVRIVRTLSLYRQGVAFHSYRPNVMSGRWLRHEVYTDSDELMRRKRRGEFEAESQGGAAPGSDLNSASVRLPRLLALDEFL